MKRHILRTATAVVLLTAMTAATVFADEVSSITDNINNAQQEIDSLQNQLSYLLVQMDDLEANMASTADQILKANEDLKAAETIQQQQQQDMKLRIKYMYEDQSTSIMETLLTSDNMSEVLNKAEYIQKIYDYDKGKLDEMAATADSILELKNNLEKDEAELAKDQSSLSSKQELLYKTIADQKDTKEGFEKELNSAIAAQAAKRAAQEAAAQKAAAQQAAAQSSTSTNNSNYVSKNDPSVGESIAKLSFNYLGTPYRSGGATPGGFDCSGFTAYLHAQFGISLSRTTGGQTGGGKSIAGLSQALPGDVICYPGHVAIYVGNGQIVHASVPGDVVKVASANIMTITAIRRYW